MYTLKKLIIFRALSSNDDKMLQTLDKITSYPYGYKHWESMQNKIVKIFKKMKNGHIFQIIHIEY